jgi:hypothetical protein
MSEFDPNKPITTIEEAQAAMADWWTKNEARKAEEARAAAEQKAAEEERAAKLAADPYFEYKEKAAQIREAEEAEEAKYQAALTLARAGEAGHLPRPAEELPREDLYSAVYGEGRDTFFDLADDPEANRAAMERSREAKEKQDYRTRDEIRMLEEQRAVFGDNLNCEKDS